MIEILKHIMQLEEFHVFVCLSFRLCFRALCGLKYIKVVIHDVVEAIVSESLYK